MAGEAGGRAGGGGGGGGGVGGEVGLYGHFRCLWPTAASDRNDYMHI